MCVNQFRKMSLKLVDASSMQTGSSEKLDQSAIAFAHETLEAVQKGGTVQLPAQWYGVGFGLR